MNRAPDILFFSRGRGRGHATPDLVILQSLLALRPNLTIHVVSYGTGASVFEANGVDVYDLGTPERGSFWPVVIEAMRLLINYTPSLVLSHEEFCVLPVCQALEIPAILLTHWFTSELDASMQACRYAREILFLEESGLFIEPRELAGTIEYVGPILRRFDYLPCDRERARTELGIESEERLILIAPGSWTEALVSTQALLKDMVTSLTDICLRVIWLGGTDSETISNIFADDARVSVLPSVDNMAQLMIASDLVITKGSYATGSELQALGVKTIVLGHGSNPVDDVFARARTNSSFYWIDDLDGTLLAKLVRESLGQERPVPRQDLLFSGERVHAIATKVLASLDAARTVAAQRARLDDMRSDL